MPIDDGDVYDEEQVYDDGDSDEDEDYDETYDYYDEPFEEAVDSGNTTIAIACSIAGVLILKRIKI